MTKAPSPHAEPGLTHVEGLAADLTIDGDDPTSSGARGRPRGVLMPPTRYTPDELSDNDHSAGPTASDSRRPISGM